METLTKNVRLACWQLFVLSLIINNSNIKIASRKKKKDLKKKHMEWFLVSIAREMMAILCKAAEAAIAELYCKLGHRGNHHFCKKKPFPLSFNLVNIHVVAITNYPSLTVLTVRTL